MNCLAKVALLGLAAIAAPARADFQISPALGDATQGMRAAPRPIVLSPTLLGLMHRPPPATPIAIGFGRQVPLAFAVRQIVPAGVKTTFGPGVDQAAIVDWTGGGPWIGVLRMAIQPLGLRLVVGWMTVSITSG